jgi:hypothetical protein
MISTCLISRAMHRLPSAGVTSAAPKVSVMNKLEKWGCTGPSQAVGPYQRIVLKILSILSRLICNIKKSRADLHDFGAEKLWGSISDVMYR